MHGGHQHQPLFVALSLVVSVLGSWTALDLFRRVALHVGQARTLWIWTAALAMGLSIWSMHFIAMLGFDPGAAVSYDPGLTLASLLLAIGATLGAFLAAAREGARRRRIVAAGTAMGVGICVMHYVGMAALRSPVSFGYDVRLVALSFIIAIGASIAALEVAGRRQTFGLRIVAAVTLGAAVVGMHYTAMAALRLTRTPGAAYEPFGTAPLTVGVLVACATLLILCLAVMASLYDQRGNVLAALDAGGVGYWELDLKTMALALSPKGRQLFGLPPDQPVSFERLLERLAAEERERRKQIFENVVRTRADYDAEYRLVDEDRWVNVRGKVITDPSGEPRRMIGVLLDVTDRHHAFAAVTQSERRQRLLIDELNHRVKNTLATIQSICAQTARRAPSLEAFHTSFEARLLALSSTHDALTRQRWEGARLQDLLENEFRPYSKEHFELEGCDLELAPRHALSLGMVVHELATNAAKYGALSSSGGRVIVRCRVDAAGADESLVLEWEEKGGPPAVQPERTGFGSRLITHTINRELGGQLMQEFTHQGLRCVIRVPLRRETQAEILS